MTPNITVKTHINRVVDNRNLLKCKFKIQRYITVSSFCFFVDRVGERNKVSFESKNDSQNLAPHRATFSAKWKSTFTFIIYPRKKMKTSVKKLRPKISTSNKISNSVLKNRYSSIVL